MASVTLGQHSGKHHLNTDELLLFQLTTSEREKVRRKSSHDKMMRMNLSAESVALKNKKKPAAPVSAPLSSLNHQPPPRQTSTASGDSVSNIVLPTSSVDCLIPDCDATCEHASACECARASMIVVKGTSLALQKIRRDRESVNANHSAASLGCVPLRSHCTGSRGASLKDTENANSSTSRNGHGNSPRARRTSHGTNFRFDDAGLEGLQIERLTQGRSGVVKIMRSEPPRREAWSIFKQDPRVKTEKGEGHFFTCKKVTQDWCDACNRQIGNDALKCKNCSYTCHLECQALVQLDCNQRDAPAETAPSPRRPSAQEKNNAPVLRTHGSVAQSAAPREEAEVGGGENVLKEEQEEKPKLLSEEEVRAKIEEYNSQVSENGMKLSTDGTYTGFIKVHLKLRRPVTVLSPDAKASAAGPGTEAPDKRTSFYLPTDAVKQLHISSGTTVSEVIQGLLKKFTVQDNPCKFALYRQTHHDGQDLCQKLPVVEHPLNLRLLAGPDPENLTFVLKENETGEVEWHAFSLPELQNFLTILEKEESERVRQVEHRYVAYRERLLQALQETQGKPD